ncbi:DUF411 domain-containing protein [Lysobacter korlensis]|uniref:DUF411 domain-containing protein n=1 Tax=Lysobacter korlensis TaxID=553636 RepID=A0ABV6RRG4_9GAMM
MRILAALCVALALASSPAHADPAKAPRSGVSAKQKPAASAALPKVVTYKDASCGCCGNWIEHMRHHGFVVEAHNHPDMAAIKQQLGVPLNKASCHTSKVGGLVIEGHVPAEDVKRLLANRGDAVGLTVPGMPLGSPGMEMPDGTKHPYVVERINRDGSTAPYAQH